MPTISCAESSAHLEETYRFWYDVYVAEMGRHLGDPAVDHEKRRLVDPVAPDGRLLLARDRQGQIVGTLMSTWASEPSLAKYVELYGLDRLSAFQRSQSTITTKLMVAPRFRCTRLGMLLARESYRWGLSAGVRFDFIDCNDHLLPFFDKLGYRPHLGRIQHAEYGAVNSMYLAVHDSVHLYNQQSPFYRELANHSENQRVYA